MSDIHLILLLTFCTLFSQLNTINCIFFFTFPKSTHHSIVEPSNLDRASTNEDYNLPFPPFFSIFRHRSFNPFLRDSEEEKENIYNKTDTLLPTKHEEVNLNMKELEVNDSFHGRVNNTTDQVNEKKLTTFAPKDHIGKKIADFQANSPFFEKNYDPLNRLHLFRQFHLRHSGSNWRNQEEAQRTKQNATQRPQLTSYNVNETEAAIKDSFLITRENCTRRHFISKYFVVWSINWASLAMHLIFILLISAAITLGILFCRPYCLTEQSRTQFQFKSLNV